MTTDLMTIEPPNGDQNVIAATRRMIADARIEKTAEIEAATEALNGENFAAEKKSKFKAEKDAAKEASYRFLKRVLASCGADCVTVELAAYQTAVNNAVKAYEAKWDAVKAENTPPLPEHTYFYAVTATDEQHVSLQKQIAKVDCKFGVVAPQNDAEWKTAAKLFGGKESK